MRRADGVGVPAQCSCRMGPILKILLPSRLLLTDAITSVGLCENGVDGAGDEEHSHGGVHPCTPPGPGTTSGMGRVGNYEQGRIHGPFPSPFLRYLQGHGDANGPMMGRKSQCWGSSTVTRSWCFCEDVQPGRCFSMENQGVQSWVSRISFSLRATSS